MLSHYKNAFLLGMSILLTGLASPAARANIPRTVMQAAAIARIEHIIVSGTEEVEAEGVEALVTRASNKEVQSAKRGMDLYANDLVTTGGNVKLIIRCLNLPSQNDSKAVLYPNTQIKIVDNTSYFVILGKAWFGVKGLFSVRTFYWILGARGTEFEVDTDKLSDTTLAVLDGVVGVSETEENKARREKRTVSPSLDVRAREEISLIGPMTRATQPKPLSELRVRSILSSANEAILDSQPLHPAKRVVPHFVSPLERSRAFESARFNAVWRQQPAAYDIVGNIHSDWGEGAKALEAYNKELSLNPQLKNSAVLLTNIGESFRLIDELNQAETFVKEALKIQPYSASALNALGNIYLGRAEAAHSNNDLDSARRLLQIATEMYEQSLTLARLPSVDLDLRMRLELIAFGKPDFETHNLGARFDISGDFDGWRSSLDELQNQFLGVTQVSIGDAKTLLADIAQEEKDPKRAAELYAEAQQAYRKARGYYPDYPYIEIGLDRVRKGIEALPSVETSKVRNSNKLVVPFTLVPPKNDAQVTATSLAAVVSYLGDSDVEPCEIVSVLYSILNCCDEKNYYACSAYYFPDEFSNWELVAKQLDRRYHVGSRAGRLLSYEEIASWIDRGVPMIAPVAQSHAIVISGYVRPDTLIVLDPSVRGEKTIQYGGLPGGLPMIKFHAPKPVSEKTVAVIKAANRIVTLFMDGEFDRLESIVKVRSETLEDRWQRVVRPLGRLTSRNRARVNRNDFEVRASVRCSFEKGVVEFVMTFDRQDRVRSFALRSQ